MIGGLGRPHGLDGFLGIYIDDEDLVSVDPGSEVFLGDLRHIVREVRRTDRGFQIAFENVTDRDSAEEIRGATVSVARRRSLIAGEYWPEQLAGLEVFDEAGNEVGVVERVVNGPGQDRLLVRGTDVVFEVPFVDALVPVVDLDERRIEIVAIPGLIDGT